MTKELLEKLKELEKNAGKGWLRHFEGLKTSDDIILKAAQFDVMLTKALGEESLILLQSNETEELTEEELSAIAGGKIVVPP